MIELNAKKLLEIQTILEKQYARFEAKSEENQRLSEIIRKSGSICKNGEWLCSKVIDLSTMPNSKMAIVDSSPGTDFSTNIKTLDSNALLYGSIRPYFEKAGFTVDVDYVAGTVYQFVAKNPEMKLWILCTICSSSFHKYTKANSKGTKMPLIGWDEFGKYEAPIPTSETLEKFNEVCGPLHEEQIRLIRQIRSLRNAKSTLLKKYFGSN